MYLISNGRLENIAWFYNLVEIIRIKMARGLRNSSNAIPGSWQPGQLKEQAGFLVSRYLTLPPVPPWAVGVIWWFFSGPKKNRTNTDEWKDELKLGKDYKLTWAVFFLSYGVSLYHKNTQRSIMKLVTDTVEANKLLSFCTKT